MDRFLAWSHFARVAELSSFSAAAKDLGTTQSNVSRSVRLLEEHVGARLLARTTRRMTLTPEGAEYLERVHAILGAAEDADHSVGKLARSLGGRLRVFAPVSLGRKWVVPRLADFLHLHPNLEVELLLDDQPRDLVEERIDVSLRVGPQPDSNARLRLLGNVDFAIVASPAWLRGRKVKTPADLGAAEAVVFAGTITLGRVTLARGKERVEVPLAGRFRTNSSEGILAAARAGLGFLVAPRWLVVDEVDSGALKSVLPSWTVAQVLPLYASFAENRTPPARVERFIEFFGKALRADGLFAGTDRDR